MSEEKNVNATGDLQNLKSMFSDYQKKQAQTTTKRKTKEEKLAPYFVPRNTKETFRILPPKAGRKHIEEAFFHAVSTNMPGFMLGEDGKVKKDSKGNPMRKQKHGTIIYCPAHNDPKVQRLDGNGEPMVDQNGRPVMIPAPCPLCDKYKKELAKQDSSIRGTKKENMTSAELKIKKRNDEIYGIANKLAAKKFYIVKGIDVGVPRDGVKFWRFKHNFKNQGTLDKLLPILEDYMTNENADFSDPIVGTDLSITTADSEFNNIVYKTISAITYKGKSKLHDDALIANQWINDEMTWRDVFKPKQAPLITPLRYLELLIEGNSPFWNDTDSDNKKWEFPNHPELEEAANNRNRNLEDREEAFEQASDLQTTGSVSNMTPKLVGTYTDNATDMSKEVPVTPPVDTKVEPEPANEPPAAEVTADEKSDEEADDFDDLPF